MNRLSVDLFLYCRVVRHSLAFGLVLAACLGTGSAQAVTIDWVPVGNPGNANDTTGYGAVAYEYRISKYEVTIQQYTDFLNAVAATDTYGLYNASMATSLNIAGILQSGSSGSFTYAVTGPSGSTPAGASSPGNRPITFVSWFDAARFANWLHNGQGSGSTETGAYTLNGATTGAAPERNPGAQFYIPNENEWYKAAYYSPVQGGVGSPGYYQFATQSNTSPGNLIGGDANQANYYAGDFAVTQSSSNVSTQNYLTEVGAFTNSASYYGTFDQSGNVNEWNDLTGAANSLRGFRGGWWNGSTSGVSSSDLGRGERSAADHSNRLGFRLAAPVPVPEPATYAMALAGLACAASVVGRRRKQA